MSFSDIRDNRASIKTALIRLNPAKDITADLVLDTGTTYLLTFSETVSKVEINGVDVVSFSQSGNTVTIDLGVVLSTEKVIASFYLFITSGNSEYITEDPIKGGSPRLWKDRVTSVPEVKESIENITEGVLSVFATNFSLLNVDNYYSVFIDTSVSFIDREVVIWYKIDTEVSNVYKGFMSTPVLQNNLLNISIKSPLNTLKGVALMGDLVEESYTTNVKFTDIPNSNRKNLPIPMVFGRSSPVKPTSIDKDQWTIINNPVFDITNGDTIKACCIETDDPGSGNDYRRWSVCKLPVGVGLYPSTVYTIPSSDITIDVTATRPKTTFINVSSDLTKLLRQGDLIQYKDNSLTWFTSGQAAGHVLEVSGSTVIIDRAITVYANTDIRLPAVQMQYGSDYKDIYNPEGNEDSFQSFASMPEQISASRVFDVETETTESGGTLVKVYFVSGFESSHLGLPINKEMVHPKRTWVSRVITDTDMTHGVAIKKLVEASGLETVASTFTDADVDLSSEVTFLVPSPKERTTKIYLSYIQSILVPAFGYLRVEPDTTDNDELKIGYHLLPDTIPTPSTVLTNEHIVNNSLTIRFTQEELITEISFVNEAVEDEIDESSVIVTNNDVRYLYSRESTIEQKHSLLDTQRAQKILDFRSLPKRIYTFKTYTKHLDGLLGDYVRLEIPGLPGGRSQVDLIVISISKQFEGTTIKAIELGE